MATINIEVFKIRFKRVRQNTLQQIITSIFTALHVLQTRYSDENSVRPSVCLSVRLSVCPSVTRVIPDKTEKDLSRFIYHTKEHLS